MTITLAITGASGAQYGLRLLECLLSADQHVLLLISKAARLVIATETDISIPAQTPATQNFLEEKYHAKPEQLTVLGLEQWMAAPASGSSRVSKMVICPASTGTLSAVANGACNNLIERAADVALKENRQLILVPREAPYNAIHLEHMLTLTQMGCTIIPASPGFYNKPQSIDDLIDFIVARILDHLGVEQKLVPRWGK